MFSYFKKINLILNSFIIITLLLGVFLLCRECYSKEPINSKRIYTQYDLDTAKINAYLNGVKYCLAKKGYDKSYLSTTGDTIFINEVTNTMLLNDLSNYERGKRIKAIVIDDNRWFKNQKLIDEGLK